MRSTWPLVQEWFGFVSHEEVTDAVYRNYQGFFGRGIKRQKNFFKNGLTTDAIKAAQKDMETVT